MPDLDPGTTVRGLDTPPTVSDEQPDQYTATITSYGVTAASGTYADCGVAFVACTTGRALISFGGRVAADASNTAFIAPVVRTGSTVGSGTSVVAASDDNALFIVEPAGGGVAIRAAGPDVLVTGLTPGDSYNVRLEHRVSAGTGTLNRRSVTVAPST